jgi:hypothetical protein
MKTKILSIVQQIDRSYMKLFPEKPHLTIALFHKIFEKQADINLDQTLPNEKLTISDFEKVLAFFQEQNYHFVSPQTIEKGNLQADKKYLLLTFDYGYFNNTYILPILEKYAAPALFFISTAYTEEQQPYWWDVFYRESRKKGVDFQAIIAQIEVFKTW